MTYSGKKCRLTAAQAEELAREYQLGLELRPAKLCAKYGINPGTLRNYVNGRHKIGPKRRAVSDTGTPK